MVPFRDHQRILERHPLSGGCGHDGRLGDPTPPRAENQGSAPTATATTTRARSGRTSARPRMVCREAYACVLWPVVVRPLTIEGSFSIGGPWWVPSRHGPCRLSCRGGGTVPSGPGAFSAPPTTGGCTKSTSLTGEQASLRPMVGTPRPAVGDAVSADGRDHDDLLFDIKPECDLIRTAVRERRAGRRRTVGGDRHTVNDRDVSDEEAIIASGEGVGSRPRSCTARSRAERLAPPAWRPRAIGIGGSSWLRDAGHRIVTGCGYLEATAEVCARPDGAPPPASGLLHAA